MVQCLQSLRHTDLLNDTKKSLFIFKGNDFQNDTEIPSLCVVTMFSTYLKYMFWFIKIERYMGPMRENRSSRFPTRSDTNRPVQSQKNIKIQKFWVSEEEKLYYPCSEKKGTDQLRSYCEADLRL